MKTGRYPKITISSPATTFFSCAKDKSDRRSEETGVNFFKAGKKTTICVNIS